MKVKGFVFIEFIITVALLMALVSMTINMLLPAFQSITTDLQLTNQNQIHLGISLLYLGLGTSQFIYGAISDSVGRKPTIYIGLLLFILGCIISCQSQSLNTLIVGQIIQGFGLGAPRVMSVAIVRDKFEGSEMAKVMSFIMVIYILTPVISPLAGKSIITIFNWRTLFLAFIIISTLLFLLFKFRMPETLLKAKRQSFTLKHIKKASFEVLTNKVALSYTIILGLYSGVFIAYLNLSQAVFEFQYDLKEQYPYYFALLAISIGLASFYNGKMVIQFGMKKLVFAAIIISIITVIPFIISSYLVSIPLWVFIAFMFIELFSYGLLIGNLNALAMQPLGYIAGLAASIIGAVSTLISVPLSIVIGSFYDNNTLPIAIGFLLVGVTSIFTLLNTNRTNKYEKQNSQQLI